MVPLECIAVCKYALIKFAIYIICWMVAVNMCSPFCDSIESGGVNDIHFFSHIIKLTVYLAMFYAWLMFTRHNRVDFPSTVLFLAYLDHHHDNEQRNIYTNNWKNVYESLQLENMDFARCIVKKKPQWTGIREYCRQNTFILIFRCYSNFLIAKTLRVVYSQNWIYFLVVVVVIFYCFTFFFVLFQMNSSFIMLHMQFK